MSGKKDAKVYKEDYDEDEEEDKKCPPNLHVSHKKGRATLVYNEKGEDAKCPPQQVPWPKENEERADHKPKKRRNHRDKHRKHRRKHHEHEHTKQPSMESSDHQKARREFAQEDVETIEMEEGFFCAEWEKINGATDGHVPVSNPKERGVKNEPRTTTHGSSGGQHAASSPRVTDAIPGAEAVDGRAHPPNNAQRRTCTLPPTRPGAQRMPGPDCEGLDEDEDQMTFVSREETDIPIVPEAERVNPEKDRQAVIDDFIGTVPFADVVPEFTPEVSPDNKGWRRKLVGAFLLVSMVAIVVGAVLASRPDDEETMSPSGYEALLSNVSSDGGEALRNSSSPQSMAFDWTVTNNSDLAAFSYEQIIQRYALATLFFSTNGNSWEENAADWLSEGDECSWYRVQCTSSGAVSALGLYGNDGTLPAEIGLLSELAQLDLFDNYLSGVIPSEIGMLSNLEYLYFSNNTLEGTIPREFGQLTELIALDLSDNTLTGTIPSEMNSLVNLNSLDLYGNNFMGNYTCPDSIDICYISCDDSFDDTCRSL